jgi:hypothetical protein
MIWSSRLLPDRLYTSTSRSASCQGHGITATVSTARDHHPSSTIIMTHSSPTCAAVNFISRGSRSGSGGTSGGAPFPFPSRSRSPALLS